MVAGLKQYFRAFYDYAGGRLFAAFALVFVAALLEGIGLLAILPFLELFSGNEQGGMTQRVVEVMQGLGITTRPAQIGAILAGFLVLIALRNFLVWRRGIMLMRLGQGFVDHLRADLFSAMTKADWLSLRKLQFHRGTHAITMDVQRLSTGTNRILNGAVTLVLVAVHLGAAILISPMLGVGIATLLILAALIAPFAMRRAKLLGQKRTKFGKKMFEALNEFTTLIKLAKVQRSEGLFLKDFESGMNNLRAEAIRFTSQQGALSAMLQLIIACAICLVAFAGLFWLDVPILALTAVLIVVARISGPIVVLLQSAQQMANMLPAFEQFQAMGSQLASVPELPEIAPAEQAAQSQVIAAKQCPLDVRFDQVSFSYADQKQKLIQELDWYLPAGRMVALRGQSGAGKTTFFDLLSGLVMPQSGRVTLDGAHSEAAPAIRRLAYCPQDPVLLDRSLEANLRWTNPDLTQGDIMDALQTVEASEFTAALPNGLQSRVGDRGQGLSGGERQRICLARALLRKPGLLILDEATSAIDAPTEAKILANLRQMRDQMTIIIVTHRPIDPALFDGLYSLVDGQIIEDNL